MKIKKEHIINTAIFALTAIVVFALLDKLTILNVIGGTVCSWGLLFIWNKTKERFKGFFVNRQKPKQQI